MKWFDLPGFEGVYKANRKGEVYSYPSGRLLKQRILRGYPAVTLGFGEKNNSEYIHRIIAMRFIPNPENKPLVNHIDHDRTNFSVGNLEWATYKENSSPSLMNAWAIPIRATSESREVRTFACIKEAEAGLAVNRTTIRKACNSGKWHKGFKFERMTKEEYLSDLNK